MHVVLTIAEAKAYLVILETQSDRQKQTDKGRNRNRGERRQLISLMNVLVQQS